MWPSLQQEMRTQEVLAAVLQPILKLISEISTDEYENIVLPHFRVVFNLPKSIQASVTLLENIHIILEKTPSEDIATDILPIIYSGLESTTIQVQVAAVVAASNASEHLDVDSIKKTVLPRTKAIYEKNPSDVALCLTVLGCIERILDKLERSAIIDDVMPILNDVKLQDADVTVKVVNIYRLMLGVKKFGLSVNLLATKVLPSLLPLTVSPSLNLLQFSFLLQTIHEMLDHIDKQQRNKLKLDNLSLSSPGEKRLLRHQLSSDNMSLSPFSPVPNVKIQDPRMSSSAEDVLSRRGSSGPSSPDSHLLRVQSAFIGRRLSDNELMMPPKIRVAHSSASSPGETSTGSLPIRRHSSIGPERRGSTCANLSPPTLSRTLSSSLANASKSVPMLLTPSPGSKMGSRRQSTCSISSIGGLDSRRSSTASIGNPLGGSYKSHRRPSALISNSSSGNLLQQLSAGVYQLFSSKS